jgi:hypothetical protein
MPAPKGHPNWNVNNIGRPRTYDDEFIEKEANALLEWIKSDEGLYLKEFSLMRGYPAENLSMFAERNFIFRQALQLAHNWQEIKLFKGGLTKQYDSSFAKFSLGYLYKWKETKEINVVSENPLIAQIADAEGKSKDLVKNDQLQPS